MTSEADVSDVAATAGKPGISRKLLIMVAAAALVALLGGGAAAYFLLFAGKAEDTHAQAEAHDTFIFNLPAMTVNLNSEGQGEQVMKLTIALEVADESVMTEIQPRLAKVIDAFQVYLRELRKSDLEGSAGIYRLKEELRRRVNVAVFPAQVENILFREILIQ